MATVNQPRDLAGEILARMEASIAAGRLGPATAGNRPARESIDHALARLAARSGAEPGTLARIAAVRKALRAADPGPSARPAPPRASSDRNLSQRRSGAAEGVLVGQIREKLIDSIEAMIRTGEIRGPRMRKLRRVYIRGLGLYAKGERDPARRERLAAIVRGLEEADKLPALPGAARARAAQTTRAREM